MRLAYSAEAVADLTRLRAFTADKNPQAVARIAVELVSRIEQLRAFPHIGRPVERAPQPEVVRDMVFGAYIVRYSIHAEALAILRVWHQFEDRE